MNMATVWDLFPKLNFHFIYVPKILKCMAQNFQVKTMIEKVMKAKLE
jgi:hypothetical protein